MLEPRSLNRNLIFRYLLLILIPLVMPMFISSPYWLHVLIITWVNIGMAASTRLIFVAGEISVCQAAFMAIGGYTSTLLVKILGFSFWLGLPMGGIVTALIALFIGHATLRAKGIYFMLTTLAFGEVVRLLISNWRLMGAVNGIFNIPPPDAILGVSFVGKLPFYYLALILMFITLFVCYRVEKSRYGLIFRSIAQASSITESVGVNIMSYKVMAFVISSFFAGTLGSFLVHYNTMAHPDMFSLWHSIMYLIFFQIGGIQSIWGAFVGAGVLTIGAEFLRATKHLEVVSFAVLLMLMVLFMRDGLISLPSKVNRLKAMIAKRAEGSG